MSTLAEQVYAVAKLVPPGRVVSYGDLAELLGTGPRQIGQAMSQCDEPGVPWWRVTNSYGDPPHHLRERAFAHFAAEDMTIKPNGLGVSMRDYRADLAALADAAEQLLGPLPGMS